jgi:hypothetical protein
VKFPEGELYGDGYGAWTQLKSVKDGNGGMRRNVCLEVPRHLNDRDVAYTS